MAAARQLPLPFLPRPTYMEVDFIAAESNKHALIWLAQPAEWPLGRLILYGPKGSGKTHLLHLWCRRTGGTLTPASDLYAASAQPPAGPLAVDDADMAEETALFHAINTAAEARFPLLLAGREAPARWETRLPDLTSRLRASLAIGLGPAEDALLRPLLARLLAERQLDVKPAVQSWLLTHLPREAAALAEAVARLDHAGLMGGQAITRTLAVRVMREMTTHCGDDAATEGIWDEISRHDSPPTRQLL